MTPSSHIIRTVETQTCEDFPCFQTTSSLTMLKFRINFFKIQQNNDGKLTNLQLMGMAKGIADGMKYLAGIQFVHRVRLHKKK